MKAEVTGVEFAVPLTTRQWNRLPGFDVVGAWFDDAGILDIDELEWSGYLGHYLYFRVRQGAGEALKTAKQVTDLLDTKLNGRRRKEPTT